MALDPTEAPEGMVAVFAQGGLCFSCHYWDERVDSCPKVEVEGGGLVTQCCARVRKDRTEVCFIKDDSVSLLTIDTDTIAEFVRQQRRFSEIAFGPGARTEGIVRHIESELAEIRENPHDLFEWIDVMILAFDGAWRAGYTPEEIQKALFAKLAKNKSRTWPVVGEDEPSFHVKG